MTNYSRRLFLGSFAAAALAQPRSAAGVPLQAGAKGSGARGKIQKIDSEIREYKDPDTGARVRRLTGDGSDNVHLYFTSESFADGSDRIVFGSNRSGKFQLYLLEIKDKRLVQLTDGDNIEPQKASLNNHRLFYFDGPRLHCLRLACPGTGRKTKLEGTPRRRGPNRCVFVPGGGATPGI